MNNFSRSKSKENLVVCPHLQPFLGRENEIFYYFLGDNTARYKVKEKTTYFVSEKRMETVFTNSYVKQFFNQSEHAYFPKYFIIKKICSPCPRSLVKTKANVCENSKADQ